MATRLSNKLLEQGYVKERLKSSLRKFYGRYRDLIKQYDVSLSQMLNDILWPDHMQWQPPTDQTLYRTRPFPKFWVVSIEHLRRVWHADRDAYSSGHLVLSHLGVANVLLLRPLPLKNTLHHQFTTVSLIWLLTEFDITEYRFQWDICNGCGMLTGDAYSSGHLVLSLLDLHMFYLLRPILFRTCRYFTGLCSSNIPRYFLDFTCSNIYTQTKVKQHHIFSETRFWKLQNGICGLWKSNVLNFIINFITFMSTLS